MKKKYIGIIIFIAINLFNHAKFEDPSEIVKYCGIGLSILIIVDGLRDEILEHLNKDKS